jgi:S-adenosylmethionine:tRNA ribosyltransferase-isomerase
VRRADFAYELPEELIAQTPLAERSASRLLTLDGATGALADRSIRDLPDLLRAGDLLVFNDTRVVAARLVGFKPSGGRVEIFLERAAGDHHALVQLRASKPIREELEIATEGGRVRVVSKEGDLWKVALPGPTLEFFETWGEVPLPPYIHRTPDASDRQRYQSIFARHAGAVAAPTASLHFDEELIRAIEARGVKRAFVTLHVGAGTFQPVRTDDLGAHVMHAEWVSVGADTCDAINRTRAAGGRVVSIGTTVARALESAALATPTPREEAAISSPPLQQPPQQQAPQRPLSQQPSQQQPSPPPRESDALEARAASLGATSENPPPLQPYSGDTRLFISPGFKFRVVNALLTNFHLPESTLLMLVSAFAGREKVLAAYQHAVREKYRFFSYGDAMFVTPHPEP